MIKNLIKNLIDKFLNWRKNKRLTVPCKTCGKKFNAMNQSGLCPHEPIKQFIYGIDHATKGGDYSAKVKMSIGADGKVRIEQFETRRNGETFNDETETDQQKEN